jgi:O-antigen ligase
MTSEVEPTVYVEDHAKTAVIAFVTLFSVAALPVLTGSSLDHVFGTLGKVPLFLYNQDFTTVSVKEESFNYFSFTKFASLLFFPFFLSRSARHWQAATIQGFDLPFLGLLCYRAISELVLSRSVNFGLLAYMVIASALYLLLNGELDEALAPRLFRAFAVVGLANALVVMWQAYAIKMTVGEFVLRDFSNQPRGFLMDAVVASIYMTVSLVVLLEGMFPVRLSVKLIGSLVLLAGSILTGSRGFMVMLLLYAASRVSWFFETLRRSAVTLVVLAAVAMGAGLAYNDELTSIVENFQTLANYEEDLSSMSRKGKLEASLNLFLDHPLFGVGSNNFQAMTNSEAVLDETLTDNPHNVYAQILAENGIFGVALLLWIVGILVANWSRVAKSLRMVLVMLCVGMGYIGAFGSLPMLVMLVGFLSAFRRSIGNWEDPPGGNGGTRIPEVLAESPQGIGH